MKSLTFFFLLSPQIVMKLQYLRYTSKVIIFLDCCGQSYLIFSEKSLTNDSSQMNLLNQE